jgi:hypothetical protein
MNTYYVNIDIINKSCLIMCTLQEMMILAMSTSIKLEEFNNSLAMTQDDFKKSTVLYVTHQFQAYLYKIVQKNICFGCILTHAKR